MRTNKNKSFENGISNPINIKKESQKPDKIK